MAPLLTVASEVVLLAALACFLVVVTHGFRRSLGTGFMVLCIPFYQVVYGFSQFDHPRRGAVLAGWLGGLGLGVGLKLVGLALHLSA